MLPFTDAPPEVAARWQKVLLQDDLGARLRLPRGF